MLVQDIIAIKEGRIITSDGRTVDQIYKGFQIYKSGKAPAEFTAIKETKQYEGLLDDVKRQIDKYWEREDARIVLKGKNAGDRKPAHPRWRVKGDRRSVRDVSPEEEKARQYVNSIHNPSKKKYAEEYLHYMQGRSQVPKRPSDLSAMGAQAVEMQLQQLIEGGVSDQAPISRQSVVKMNVGGKKCLCGGQFVQSSVEELSGGRRKNVEKCDKCGRSQITITDSKIVTDSLDPNETHDIRDIEKETKANDYFRKVVFTAERMQLVVMCIKPGEDIGEEVHPTIDQFFRIEEGKGKAIVDGREINIKEGSSILIKSGRVHNIINDSNKPLKLYSLYSPPHHRDGLIQKEK